MSQTWLPPVGWGMLGCDGIELRAGIAAARQLSLQIIVLLQVQVLVSTSNLFHFMMVN